MGGVSNLAEAYYKLVLDAEADTELLKRYRTVDTSRATARSPFKISDAMGARICPVLKLKSLKALSTYGGAK